MKRDFAGTRPDGVEAGDGLVVDETLGAETLVRTVECEIAFWGIPVSTGADK